MPAADSRRNAARHDALPRFRDLPHAGRRRPSWCPSIAGWSSDALTPVTAFHKIDAGPLRLPVRERRRRREGRPLQLSGRRSVLRDRSLRPPGDDQRLLGRFGRRRADAGRPRQFECGEPAGRAAPPASRRCGPSTCPSCRRSAAARSAMPATTRSATSSSLPNAPPDDRQLPDLAFAFYDQMVVFDNVNKTIVVVAMARLDKPGARPGKRPTTTPGGGSTSWSSSWHAPQRDLPPADIGTGGEPTICRTGRTSRRPSSRQAVEKCVEYIRAGDIFQVVISQRLEVPMQAASVRDLPHAAGGESQPVHVLPAHAQRDAGRQLAGDHGPRGRRPGDGPPAGRHAPPRRDRRGRPPAGRGAAGRSQGAGRARDAGRSGPQRRGPRGPLSLGRS